MTATERSTDSGRRMVWAAGLVVATGAGVATAHGLFEVAVAARVPTGIAWLYPLITDGLALVAYAATARLTHARTRLRRDHRGPRRRAVRARPGHLSDRQPHRRRERERGTCGVAVRGRGVASDRGRAHRAPAPPDRHRHLDVDTDSRRAFSVQSVVQSASNPLYNSASNPAVQPRTTSERSIPVVTCRRFPGHRF